MKIYTTKEFGNCGPCSFINLVGLKGSLKLERKLAREGKLKPFQASSYFSFLVWGDKYKKDLIIFTPSKRLNNKMFQLMFEYEKIPKRLHGEYKKLTLKRFERLNKKFSSKVKTLRDPIKKLDLLLNKGYLIAILIFSFYLKDKVPHWIVAFKKEKDKYYFMCSREGIVVFTKKDLLKGFKLNRTVGYYPVLVAYKK